MIARTGSNPVLPDTNVVDLVAVAMVVVSLVVLGLALWFAIRVRRRRKG